MPRRPDDPVDGAATTAGGRGPCSPSSRIDDATARSWGGLPGAEDGVGISWSARHGPPVRPAGLYLPRRLVGVRAVPWCARERDERPSRPALPSSDHLDPGRLAAAKDGSSGLGDLPGPARVRVAPAGSSDLAAPTGPARLHPPLQSPVAVPAASPVPACGRCPSTSTSAACSRCVDRRERQLRPPRWCPPPASARAAPVPRRRRRGRAAPHGRLLVMADGRPLAAVPAPPEPRRAAVPLHPRRSHGDKGAVQGRPPD